MGGKLSIRLLLGLVIICIHFVIATADTSADTIGKCCRCNKILGVVSKVLFRVSGVFCRANMLICHDISYACIVYIPSSCTET